MERVVPYDPGWAEAFIVEADALRAALQPLAVTLHHMGSTAVRGLPAKPIIDILGVVDCLDALDPASGRLTDLGYEAMGAFGIEGRRYFRKIRTDGVRTHHLHVYQEGSPQVPRHLAFRDYLRAFPERAAAYGALKIAIVSGDYPPGTTYAEAKAGMVTLLKAEAAARRP